jgi:hypothetical protein
VGFALLPLTALDAVWLWNSLLWMAVVLALVSGAQYLWRARQLGAAGEYVGGSLDSLGEVGQVGRAAATE